MDAVPALNPDMNRSCDTPGPCVEVRSSAPTPGTGSAGKTREAGETSLPQRDFAKESLNERT